jgi:ribosomal protein S14
MPLDPAWKDVARWQPDSRTTWSRNEKKHLLLGWMEECFCANCGKSKGMISKAWAAYVFALCDDCVRKHGPPPGVVVVPDEFVEGMK